ncbi:unnamed protein product, partial [Iphiclides podalirius]
MPPYVEICRNPFGHSARQIFDVPFQQLGLKIARCARVDIGSEMAAERNQIAALKNARNYRSPYLDSRTVCSAIP